MNNPINTSIDSKAVDLRGHHITFWKLWQEYWDYLYYRCLRWMNGNKPNADEAISRATLQAWNKWLDYSETITNPKAWLTQLTHNICMDMHREGNWCGQRVESLESIQGTDYEVVPGTTESLELALLEHEMLAYLRQVINTLSPTLREPLLLHYYHEKTTREIAHQLNLSEDSVWKRLERGRAILKEQLAQYLSGMGNSLQLLHWIPLAPESQDLPTLPVSITLENFVEPINYQVTATCLQTLPHAWYTSLTPLGWS
ncbi:MAG: sigma-70 family RNA polymerase sigma factor [Symploca sp. SIO2E6]|nr:sigma-70 family RNA polymerase sigma factor [Symploca sp. SIO2E6]